MQRDLEQFIKDLKDKNVRYDEANTKSFIIERLLTHLKWDVHSPDEIFREQGLKRKIDYELRANNINIGIEAKAIKQSLNEEDGKQLLGYCGDSHILAILTNGKDWWFYLPQAEGGPSRKRFLIIDIFQDPQYAASKLIDILSKDNITNGSAFENAKLIYQGQRNEINKSKSIIDSSEKEQDYLSVDNDFTKKAIESYYFNGVTYIVTSWKGLLTGILDNIYTLHKKSFDRILGVTGGYGHIYFSKKPKAVDLPLEIKGTGIYVGTKLGANNIVRLCSDIIYEFGYSDNDLKIKISNGIIKKNNQVGTTNNADLQIGIKKEPSKSKNYIAFISDGNNDVTGMKIKSFIFDNEEYDVNSWREMLIKLIQIIHSRHKRKFYNILEFRGSQGRRYFSKRRILDDPLEIEGAGIYVEGKLNSTGIFLLCYDIISEFGYSCDDLKIEAIR